MKGLEALEEIKNDLEYITRLDYVEPIVRGEVRDKLFQIYHRELPQLDQIEEELKAGEKHKKALEIIKREPNILSAVQGYETYDDFQNDEEPWLDHDCVSRDEFDLLKEVLK